MGEPIDELMPLTWLVTFPEPLFVWPLMRLLTLSDTPDEPAPPELFELPEMMFW